MFPGAEPWLWLPGHPGVLGTVWGQPGRTGRLSIPSSGPALEGTGTIPSHQLRMPAGTNWTSGKEWKLSMSYLSLGLK